MKARQCCESLRQIGKELLISSAISETLGIVGQQAPGSFQTHVIANAGENVGTCRCARVA
jgi:hypothetical protein